MKKLISMLIAVLCLQSTVASTSIGILASEPLRAPVYELNIYSVCYGNDIIKTYSAPFRTSSGIVSQAARIMPASVGTPFDHMIFSEPVLVYRYFDSNGNVYTPYLDQSYSSSEVTLNSRIVVGGCKEYGDWY